MSDLSDITDDTLFLVVNQWAGLTGPGRYALGSPEETVAHCAFFLRARQGCQPSGVAATLRERADRLEKSNPQLAAAYRAFVHELSEWHKEEASPCVRGNRAPGMSNLG